MADGSTNDAWAFETRVIRSLDAQIDAGLKAAVAAAAVRYPLTGILEQITGLTRQILDDEWPDWRPSVARPSKDKIGHYLRTRVYERDEYRCVTCGTCLDLTLDHVLPESKGGPTTYENLQTMCRSCNSAKGTRWGITP